MVRRAVGAGDAGAVEDDGDARLVERAVHEELVEGPVEEGGVDGDDRVQAGIRQPRRHGEGVLLRDADVEGAVGEALAEVLETDGDHHGGGDGDDVVALLADADHLVAELVGPAAAGDLERKAGLGVDDPDGVELVPFVVDRRVVAAPLLGEDVHEDRPTEGAGLAQRRLDRLLVVAVDRADVLEPEVLEEALRRDDVLDALLHPVERLVHRATDDGSAGEGVLAPVEEPLVALGRPQRGEVVGEPTAGGGVGALVVVHDDDQGQVGLGRDVVERLPGHATGEGAVADDGHGVPTGLPTHDAPGRDAVGPGERGGGVRVLDDVVLGLGAARVAGEPSLGAQAAEVVAPGEQLVHVGLVPGVEHHRVVGRGEHPVDRDRQLDDAEVGAEVPSGAGDLVDEEAPDLLGEGGHLVCAQCPEVVRALDALEQAHRRLPPGLSGRRNPLSLGGRRRSTVMAPVTPGLGVERAGLARDPPHRRSVLLARPALCA